MNVHRAPHTPPFVSCLCLLLCLDIAYPWDIVRGGAGLTSSRSKWLKGLRLPQVATSLILPYVALQDGKGQLNGVSAVEDENLKVALDFDQAIGLVHQHGRGALHAIKQGGSFLYRGEPYWDGGVNPHLQVDVSAFLVTEEPDLLDKATYGSQEAADYFMAVDNAIRRQYGASSARPSNAHIMVANREAAGQWGTACSVWPLGTTLDYAWLADCKDWWDPAWTTVETGKGSPMIQGYSEPFFWRDGARLTNFLSANLHVNEMLPQAIRSGHEVLIRAGRFQPATPFFGQGTSQVFTNSFICFPATLDRYVGSALGCQGCVQ
ncbi:unnamed protein product [Choristocarpus tenellus]